MLKINFDAEIREAKRAAEAYLHLINYDYCDPQEKENYNYMQGLADAIELVERRLETKFD